MAKDRSCSSGRCSGFHDAVQSYNENHSQYTPGSMSDKASGQVLQDRNNKSKGPNVLTSKQAKAKYGNDPRVPTQG
jgi:hypothetical protein